MTTDKKPAKKPAKKTPDTPPADARPAEADDLSEASDVSEVAEDPETSEVSEVEDDAALSEASDVEDDEDEDEDEDHAPAPVADKKPAKKTDKKPATDEEPPTPEASEETPQLKDTRGLVYGSRAAVISLAAVAVATLINMGMSQVYWRADMTDQQIYTLDEVSRTAARKTDAPVKVTAFISPNMPMPFHTLEQTLGDTLGEYQAASGGNLSFSVVRVQQGSADEKRAEALGCRKSAVGTESAEELSVRAVFKCVVFEMKAPGEQATDDKDGLRREVIPDMRLHGVPELDQLEYDLTLALLNLNNKQPRKLGFVTGFGGPVGQDSAVDQLKPAFKQLYGKLIEPVAVNLDAERPFIPEDVSALVLMELTLPLTPLATFELDRFVQRGGNIAWYQSGTAIDGQLTQLKEMKRTSPDQIILPSLKTPKLGVTELVEAWGIRHNKDLLVDPEHAMRSMVMTRSGPAPMTHPATFQITALDRTQPWLATMPPLAFPMPSSVAFTDKALADKSLKRFELFKTEKTAMQLKTKPIELAYEEFLKPNSLSEPGVFLIGAAIQGALPSYYTDHPLPKGRSEADLHKGAPKTARVMVWGSGTFIEPQPQVGYDPRIAAVNQQLFLNSLDWVAQDNALSAIRDKSVPRFLGKVPDDLQRSIKFINIAAVPAAFMLLGYLMLQRRRLRRRKLLG